MPTTTIDNEVVDFVRHRDYVSMVEVERFLKGKIALKGDSEWGILDKNIGFWFKMSNEFADLMIRLIDQKRLFVHPASRLIYMIDGVLLSLPVATRNRTYKKMHWLPITLRVVPLKENR